ncbi:MAG: carbohydrate-binding protein [Chitinophagaceae bacterium]
MRKIYLFFFIICAGILNLQVSGQIVAWNNNALTGITAGSINATTNDANLNTSVLSRGSGITATSLGGGYASSNWVDVTQALAITNNRYYQSTISANNNFKVSLSTLDFKIRRTGTGPNAYIWRYSTDGTNFTDIGLPVSFTTTTSGGDVQPQIALAGIAALQNVASGTVITLRLYAWGASAAGGTLAFGTGNVNSLAFGGTVTTGVSTTPTITPSPNSLSGFSTASGIASPSQSVVVNGNNLTDNITVTPSSPYEVSLNNSAFFSSVPLNHNSGTVNNATVYVRISASASVGTANGTLTFASPGATDKTVSLSGAVTGLINLTASPYVQNFNGIGTGLPAGVSVKTGATASALGTDATFTTAPVTWNNTGGAFKNFASGNNDEGVSQNTATDRAAGVRQTGSFGDPGAAFVFQVANTTGKINFALDFNLQSLDASSTRTTTWRVDYGLGLNPSTFIVPATTGNLTTGGGTFSNNPIHVSFGNSLDNQSGIITIRIVSVTASSGANNRPSTGIDDFTLAWEDPTAKTISLSTASINFETTNIGGNNIKTYKVIGQTNLDHPIEITAVAPFTISDDNVTFVSSLSVAAANAFDKTIYVKFSPAAAGVYNGSITHSSEGAVSKIIDLSGEAVDPTSLTFNFNTCTVSSIPGSGFLSINTAGTQKWGCSQYGRNSSNGVDVNGFSGGAAQTNDAWLISPALNLNNIVNLPVLSFYSRGEFTGPKLQLYISTTYDGSSTPNLADWTEITTANFPNPPGSATTAWTLSDNIDLSAYKAAPVVYIAFRYTSSAALNAARWSVDDIAITDQSTLLTISPVQLSFGEVSVGTNSPGQAVSLQAIGSSDLTITPPAGYQISTNNNDFTSNPIVINQATASAGTTLYVRFSPVAKALKVEGNIKVTATGLNKDVVAVTGSSYPKAETFDVACYNISFFGANSTNTATESQIATQVANISTVMQRLNADVIGIEEMSNDAALAQLIGNLPGYASVMSPRWSYSFNPPDPSFPPQKIGFIYNTSTMSISSTEPPRVMFESMYDSARLDLPNHRLTDYPTGTPSSFWGSGRLPFMATFNATLNGVTEKIRIIVLHAKSGGDAEGYTRRQYDVKVLKDSLDAFYANDKVLIIGDYNDRVVTSIYVGHPSSYLPFVNDEINYNILTKPLDQAGRTSFPSSNGLIDHITITNDMVNEYISNSTDIEDPRSYIANYNATTASDHLPVFSRYKFTPPVTPTFDPIGPLYQNTTPPELPLISKNGITGTWNPATISTAVIGTAPYTFTPNDGQNAVSTIINIQVVDATTKLIPGKIEAESYNAHFGGMYAVATSDAGGGQQVIGITNNSWMDYNVLVTQAGTYNVSFRVATPQLHAQFQLKLGNNVIGTVNISNTGEWNIWQTVTINNVSLSAGAQTLRVLSTNDESCNFNWMNFEVATVSTAPTVNAGSPQTIGLPTNQVTLSGSASANNGGSITFHQWTKFSGGTANITHPDDYTTTVTGLQAGAYVFRLTARDNDNQESTSDVTITVNPDATAGKVIPGKIEAENYDAHFGGMYAVATTDAGGGQQVIGITNNSWMDYNVTVTQAGTYNVSFRVATPQQHAQFQLKLGSTVLGTVNIPNTGEWNIWQTITITNVSLSAGAQTLRVLSTNNESCNFNWMNYELSVPSNAPTVNAGSPQTITLPNNQVTLSGNASANNGGSITFHEWSKFSGGNAAITTAGDYSTTVTSLQAGTYVFRLTARDNENHEAYSDVTITVNPDATAGKVIPGKIEAESYDAHFGGMYGVATSDAGGGQQVIGITNASWMDYNVTVTQGGTYNVSFRVATPQQFAQFQLKLGSTVLGTVNIPNTGEWNIWKTVTINNVSLSAGAQTLRVLSTNNESCNFNWMNFELAAAPLTLTRSAANIKEQANEILTDKLAIAVSPNPATAYFNLKVQSKNNDLLEIKVYNIQGRLVGTMRGGSNQTFRLGDNFLNGIYLIEVSQGNEKITTKVIKQ